MNINANIETAESVREKAKAAQDLSEQRKDEKAAAQMFNALLRSGWM